MPKVKLTHAFCAGALCEPGKRKTDWYDTVVTGFVFEKRAGGGGGGTYYLRYQDARGRQKQHKIARHGEITFDQARKEAQRLRSQVILGGDPAAEKAETRAVVDYAELAAQHLAYASTYQKTPANTERILRIHLLPRWGKVPIDEITQADVAKWLAAKSQEGLAPATVEKIRVTLNRSFELAIRWNLPGVTTNPVKGIQRKPIRNGKNRFLTSEEAARLRAAAKQSLNPQLANIIGLLLLTGARKRELLDARWENIDHERKLWFLPMTKNGSGRHVPLSRDAMDIIEQLPRFEDCPWLVPNPATKKPYTDLKRPFDTARRLAGLSDVTIHTLRHTCASFLVAANVDLFAVGKILGHKSVASTQRYSHLANNTLLAALEAGAAKMREDA